MAYIHVTDVNVFIHAYLYLCLYILYITAMLHTHIYIYIYIYMYMHIAGCLRRGAVHVHSEGPPGMGMGGGMNPLSMYTLLYAVLYTSMGVCTQYILTFFSFGVGTIVFTKRCRCRKQHNVLA